MVLGWQLDLILKIFLKIINCMILSFYEYFYEQWLGGLYKTYTNLYQPSWPLFHKVRLPTRYILDCFYVFPLPDWLLYVVHDTESSYKCWLLYQMASEAKSDHV